MQITNIVSIRYNELINEFEKHTGWASTRDGAWNADFTKPVFDVELVEVFQREQDWMVFVYADTYDVNKKDKEALLKKENSEEYRGHTIYSLYLSDIVTWMVLNGHLPDENFLVIQ